MYRLSPKTCERADSPVRTAASSSVRTGRCFYADPMSQPPTGRPRRHGAEFACNDPTTWPTPTDTWTATDPQYGQVRLRAWADLQLLPSSTPCGEHGNHDRWSVESCFASRSSTSLAPPSRLSRCGSGGTGLPHLIWPRCGGPTSPVYPLSRRSAFSNGRWDGRHPSCIRPPPLTGGRGCSSSPMSSYAWRVTTWPMCAYLGSPLPSDHSTPARVRRAFAPTGVHGQPRERAKTLRPLARATSRQAFSACHTLPRRQIDAVSASCCCCPTSRWPLPLIASHLLLVKMQA